MAQRLKNLPAMWETWVQSLGWEDPLEKEMATHSSILAWRIPWTEEPDGLQSTGSQRVGHDWATSLSLSHGYTTNFFSLSPSLWISAVQEIIVAKGRMFLPRDPIMASLIWREDCLRLLMQPANRQKGSHKEHRWELTEPGGTSFH